MHHYPHHLGDYAKDTMHLSPLEHGVYRLLMDAYYATEKPIPADPASACRIARCVTEDEQKAVGKVLADFFTLTEDGYRQKRIDEEIQAYQERAEIARENGRRGGRPANPEKTDRDTKSDTKRVSGKEPRNNPDAKLTNNQEPRTNTKPKATPPDGGFELPEWVPQDAWQAFETMRKSIRAPLTAAARSLTVRDLESLKAKGYPPRAVLEQSVKRGWRGVFEIKGDVPAADPPWKGAK